MAACACPGVAAAARCSRNRRHVTIAHNHLVTPSSASCYCMAAACFALASCFCALSFSEHSSKLLLGCGLGPRGYGEVSSKSSTRLCDRLLCWPFKGTCCMAQSQAQPAAAAEEGDATEAAATSMRQGVAEWRDILMSDPITVELIRQTDDEKLMETEAKFVPVEDAVQLLLRSLAKASVSAALIAEVEDVVSTLVALSIRAAVSDPAALAAAARGADSASHSQCSAGLSIRSTALGRRASASYRIFDRMGGWEILSACVDGVYMRVMKDPRIGTVELEAEQTLKTTLVEFLSAAFSGIHGRAASCSMWKKHQEIVHELGLEPTYFDCIIEHFQATLDELGVPQEEAQAAITALRTSKPTDEDLEEADRSSMPGRLSLFGRQSLRTSLSLNAETAARLVSPDGQAGSSYEAPGTLGRGPSSQ